MCLSTGGARRAGRNKCYGENPPRADTMETARCILAQTRVAQSGYSGMAGPPQGESSSGPVLRGALSMSNRNRFFVGIAFAAMLSANLTAQSIYGTLTGIVSDPSQAVVAGA